MSPATYWSGHESMIAAFHKSMFCLNTQYIEQTASSCALMLHLRVWIKLSIPFTSWQQCDSKVSESSTTVCTKNSRKSHNISCMLYNRVIKYRTNTSRGKWMVICSPSHKSACSKAIKLPISDSYSALVFATAQSYSLLLRRVGKAEHLLLTIHVYTQHPWTSTGLIKTNIKQKHLINDSKAGGGLKGILISNFWLKVQFIP